MSMTAVAKMANVSVSTVSRLINGAAYVAPEKAALIEASMKALNYFPSAVRPGPKPMSRRGIRTGQIMLLSLGTMNPADMYTLPAFPMLLGAIQERLAEHDLHLVLGHSPTGRETPRPLVSNGVDGVLLVGAQITVHAGLRRLLGSLPVVWTFRSDTDPSGIYDHVFYDNQDVGALAASYLCDCGHRRVAFLNPVPEHPAFQVRQESFVAKAVELGLDVVVETAGSDSMASSVPAIEAAIRRLADRKPAPTGVALASDDAMLVAFNALRANGIVPQQDMDLIGCNNEHRFMLAMRPRPATIDIRLDTVGRQAVDRLLWRMQHPEESERVDIRVKPVLIPGEESKCSQER